MDDARIGDFSKPVAPKPPAKAQSVGGMSKTASDLVASGATHDALVAAENQISEEVTRDEEALKPMVSYEEKLKAAKLTREKAAEIIDAVLLKGFWAEDVPITSTIKARFRSRNARDTSRAQETLEAQRWTLDAHYNEAMTRMLLAASLERFGNDKWEHPNPRKDTFDVIEKAFAERLTYVNALPDPALRILFRKLWTFDNRVSVALEEGTIENF